jgi:hypothetical protein
MTKNKNKEQERKILCKIRRIASCQEENFRNLKKLRLNSKSSPWGLKVKLSLSAADALKNNNSEHAWKNVYKKRWKFQDKIRRKRTLRPWFYTVSNQTPKQGSEITDFDQNYSFLERKKSTKIMSKD